MRGLKNKRVIITGGARGIGFETAKRFHQEGAHICIVDMPALSETDLEKCFSERMTYIQANLACKEGRAPVIEWMNNGVDVLINNAGITRDATMAKMTEENWDQVMDVNLKSVFMLSQAAASIMKNQNSGVILHASSVVAHYGNFGQCNYVASKAAVIGLTKTMAKELGKNNVRVNAVAPGFIGTPMVRAMPEKVISMMEEKVPLKRLGEPEEIAAMFAFLASDDAKYITGATFNVDGGIILG